MKLFAQLESQFVIPVIRHKDEETLFQLARALSEAGMKVLEITLMSDAALEVIKKLSQDKTLLIGAGTVVSEALAQKSIEAGAKFLVSPGMDEASVQFSQSKNIPFIPGVLTPSEIIQAQKLGIEMVKVFPVGSMGGASYLKNLQAPFPEMKWMATGGVAPSDARSYYEAGASCIGLGNHLMPADKIKAKDWNGISEIARNLLAQIQQAKAT